mmetsp:Transcript_32516/g.41593  ORF Transcript_32516/g.41593 Transcript_32516/m.41593 type:complete len:605 (-) Transcript_32516:367-2181(-)
MAQDYGSLEDGIPKLNAQEPKRELKNFSGARFRIWSTVVALTFVFVGLVVLNVSSKQNSLVKTTINFENFKSEDERDGKTKHPHLIFLLIDDQGWNDMGYINEEIYDLMPNLGELANKGIKLTNYYTEAVCTPARAALMTGKYPIHTGMQHNIIGMTSAWGLPLNHTLLPEFLRDEYGYRTHMVGKWHLGFFHPAYIPTSRGFDTHFGYYTGSNDYYTHKMKSAPGSPSWVDWQRNGHPAEIDGTIDDGYSLSLMADEVDYLLEQHDKSEPFFLYYSTQAAHSPLSDPPRHYISKKHDDIIQNSIVVGINNTNREKFLRIEVALDKTVERLIDTLKRENMYDDTIIFVTSDNGGCSAFGGDNWPLRGGKNSLWEGGVKVPAFVHSPMLRHLEGRTFDELFHVTDWLPTIVNGIINEEGGSRSVGLEKREFDGVNQWYSVINSDGDFPPLRDQILFNLEYFKDDDSMKLAYRNGPYKLVFGEKPLPIYSKYLIDTSTESICEVVPHAYNQTTHIFNIDDDPSEKTNLYSELDEKRLSNMWIAIDSFWDSAVESNYEAWKDHDHVRQKVWLDHGNYTVPWYHYKEKELNKFWLPREEEVITEDGDI